MSYSSFYVKSHSVQSLCLDMQKNIDAEEQVGRI